MKIRVALFLRPGGTGPLWSSDAKNENSCRCCTTLLALASDAKNENPRRFLFAPGWDRTALEQCHKQGPPGFNRYIATFYRYSYQWRGTEWGVLQATFLFAFWLAVCVLLEAMTPTVACFFEKDDCVRPWNENDHDVYKQQTTASFFGSFSGKGQEAANNDNSYSSPSFSFL